MAPKTARIATSAVTSASQRVRRASTIKTPRMAAHDAPAPATSPGGALVGTVEEAAPVKLSAKLHRTIAAISAPFRQFTTAFQDVTATRDDIAPAFMKAATAYQTETGLTFVDFVRLLDPTVPADRDGYRNHKSYQAADYLRRKVQQAAKPARDTNRVRPLTPLDGMARILNSLLTLISADQAPRLWEAITSELHWSERQVQALQQRAEHTDPLVTVRAPHGQAKQGIPQLRIAPVRHADTDEQEEVSRTGTHG